MSAMAEHLPFWIRYIRYGRNVEQQSGFFYPMDFDTSDPETGKMFLETRARLHELFIRETEKTKRTALWLAAALIALACSIPFFAPPGREIISYWISGALFVFAAGSAGYTTVSIKLKKRSLSLSKPN
jgi:hypothetical protein